MSYRESLNQARKERLKRFASRAVPQAEGESVAPRLVRIPDDRASRARQDKIDAAYERAWAAAILGWTEPDDRPRGKPRIEAIQRATAHEFGLRREDLLVDRREIAVARPRHVAMYLARDLTAKSYAEIGRCFGRDHTAVVHAVKRVGKRIAHDARLADSVDRIRKTLDEYPI